MFVYACVYANVRRLPTDSQCLVNAVLKVGIVEGDLQTKGLRALCHRLADATEANDADLLVAQANGT